MKPFEYLLSFLLKDEDLCRHVFYGSYDSAPTDARIVIVSSPFFDSGIYGTNLSFPQTPFPLLPETDIPFLFGEPRIEHTEDDRIILYADLVASACFLLSRYEEVIKPDCRDQYGRFRAKDSVIFQQGYGMRPLVDEWGLYLRNLLRQCGVAVSQEKHGFSKIYLTHDVDRPFFLPSCKAMIVQIGRNFLGRGVQIKNPIKAYLTGRGDPFFTFPWIAEQDNSLRHKLGADIVEVIYFLISAKSTREWKYFPVKNRKYKKLLSFLKETGARFGLHVSHEGGMNPENIPNEIKRLPSCADRQNLLSRHHYLRWTEPEHIVRMQDAGIKHDFTLGYADSAGFRVGTCRPYKFINPRTMELTDVMIHPMEVMECSLAEKQYMGLSEEEAVEVCRNLIKHVHYFNGEFVVLFHNSSFVPESYHESLYIKLLEMLNDQTL